VAGRNVQEVHGARVPAGFLYVRPGPGHVLGLEGLAVT
jgi:hypothetical protein